MFLEDNLAPLVDNTTLTSLLRSLSLFLACSSFVLESRKCILRPLTLSLSRSLHFHLIQTLTNCLFSVKMTNCCALVPHFFQFLFRRVAWRTWHRNSDSNSSPYTKTKSHSVPVFAVDLDGIKERNNQCVGRVLGTWKLCPHFDNLTHRFVRQNEFMKNSDFVWCVVSGRITRQ